ncbi:MAG: response regulator [Lachnospiraceae bacterium]|nr:response regulator [Lachnospiraceae bacterium]
MIKLFLVEDEIAMREGIKKHIDWESEDIEFVGEASDGELAFPMILEKKPDILLTDIKMPFVDGLELSEMVRRELPDTQIMILSGYDEFEYARKAISLGVTEYILKPIAPAALLEKIKQVQKKIEEDRIHQKHLSNEEKAETIEQDRLKLFSALVMNTMSMPDILSQGKDLHIGLTGRYFAVALFSFRVEGEKENDYSEVRNRFRLELDETVGAYENWYVFDREENGFALLGVGSDEADFADEVPEVVDEITALIEDTDHASYFMGVSTIVDRLSRVKDAYYEANRAFSKRFLMQQNQVIYADEAAEKEEEDEKAVMDLSVALTNESAGRTVESFLKTGTFDEIAPFVENIFESIGEKNTSSVLFVSYITMDMYVSVARFLKELGYDAAECMRKFGDINEILKDYDSLAVIIDFMKNILTEAIHIRDNTAEKKYGSLLAKALSYIDENFRSDEISLNNVASAVNVSPNHLSSIFSKEMGMTFIEYLIKKRMDEAKELLMTTNKRSSEIAYEIGYKDPHYFSYTFKKTVGMTTKEYRARGEHE